MTAETCERQGRATWVEIGVEVGAKVEVSKAKQGQGRAWGPRRGQLSGNNESHSLVEYLDCGRGGDMYGEV